MRILVHEFASGGGLAGRPVFPSLAREGAAMRSALVADLAALGTHEIVTTADLRFPLAVPRGVEVVTIGAGTRRRWLDELIASADAVWLVAPETDRWLERLAAKVERAGKTLLGCGSGAISRAAKKSGLPALLRRLGVAHPETRVLPQSASRGAALAAARRIGFPVVVKPARGAGCEGVWCARNPGELRDAVNRTRSATSGAVLLQRYVPGVAASVSLLADGVRSVPMVLNGQTLRGRRPFAYKGGVTPLDHPFATRALEAARVVCDGLTGLRGYVGIDVVLTKSDVVVIEVNPRLTTAYLGLRAVVDENIAALAMAACAGTLPPAPRVLRRARFTSAGTVNP